MASWAKFFSDGGMRFRWVLLFFNTVIQCTFFLLTFFSSDIILVLILPVIFADII